MKNYTVFLVMFTLFGLSGCSSTKQVSEETAKRDGNKKTTVILEQIKSNELNYPKSLSFKANTEMIKGETTTSFKTSVRMVSDSVIWLSISAYGYEVARILSTPDSIKFVSRTDKTYYVGDYSFIENKLGVTFGFQELQSLIFAHSFGLESVEKVQRSNNTEQYVLSSIKQGKLKRLEKGKGEIDQDLEIVFTNWINPSSYAIEKVAVLDLKTQNRASIQYATLEKIDDYSLLASFKMNIIANENVEIESNFSKFEVNEPLRFPFKISSKYVQIK